MIEPLRYNVLLPHLFKFAYFVHMEDGACMRAYMRAER